ncbi:MAG TPA: prolyl oligopeptidase family serine peptidase [Streptosporangiaceae bacterium]|nr:prolyl oligopeptidase family serine peptidase [Streptosporangiaceae bacterium]
MPGTADVGWPRALRVPSVRTLHGRTETDDYAWMRDHSHPAFVAYLAAERGYYDAYAARLADLAGRLYAESAGRIGDQADDSVSWPLGGFSYRTRTPQDRENLQLLRSQSGKTTEQVLLDENIIGAQTGYVDVGVREPSPAGDLLAWSADTSGAEIYRLRIRDLGTGNDLPDDIDRTYPGVAWSADARYLYYLVPDELNRPFQLWRHQVGTAAAGDVLLFTETDARYEITLHASRSGRFAVVTSECRDATEVRLISLAGPPGEPVMISQRRRGLEYRVDHARAVGEEEGPAGAASAAAAPGGWLYIVTDATEPEFTLVRAPARAPGRENWVPVDCAALAPARADTRLLSCDVVGERLVLTLRRDGEPMIAITDLDGGGIIEVPPGLPAGAIRVEHAEDYDAGSVIVAEESLTEPPAWYRLDLATGERSLLKRREVPGYDPGQYLTERVTATARDGAAVPVTLAYRAGTALDGTAPCLLYGYGAYEACSDPEFGVGLPSLLDRGVVYAIAHVRGGGERGRAWWQAGRLRAKTTTFTDFIDVADWLAGRDGTALVDPARIVSHGLSAGGLLQGAVYSMRPDRWRAVVAEVPFVDCVTTMLDPSIPLTISEWDEWGDPRDPDDYACLRSYSPYDNPPAGQRPALLVTGAVHDARVAVHEPAKWVARLRATAEEWAGPAGAAGSAGSAGPAGAAGLAGSAGSAGSAGQAPVLFRVELGVGAHTGPSGRFAKARYEAEVHAFVLSAMGITR